MPDPAPSPASEPTAVVFDIQRFSIHDGPGIRTTVFLKGCPLRCAWCANPESQEATPVLLVRDAACRRSGACIEACPEGAITLAEGAGREIDWTLCTQCLRCVDACRYGSLNACGRHLGVDVVVAEAERDRPFYETSNGGVTISGGEALAQPDFLLALLTALKREGLHTALDTSGFAPWDTLEQVLPFVDLLLWDVKHLDPAKHLEGTGVSNDMILGNLRRAARRVPVWLRVPLVEGYNDARDHVAAIVDLAREIGAERISLLPYHEGGEPKSRQIGRAYGFEEGRAPNAEHVAALREWIEQQGVAAHVET